MSLSPISIVLILLAVLITLATAGHFFLRPRMLRWGASLEEASRTMPGDELIPDSIMTTTRAVQIRAAPERVWPWLAQMGQGRAGFYSYDWLENLVGMDIHNADRIIPELQTLKPGDLVPFWRGAGVNVVTTEPPNLLVLAGTIQGAKADAAGPASAGGTWVFLLSGTQAQETRLIVRARVAGFPPRWLSTIMMLFMEPMHFIMERKMLLRIKELVEKSK